MELTRRDLLLRATIGTAALGILGTEGALGAAKARATDDGVYPRFVWEPVVSVTAPTPDSLFPSLLPAGALTPSTALDAWYLWFWTHNSPTRFFLYTAPSPEGPFTGPRTLLNGMPTTQPFPGNYHSDHFDSGDVVWDAVGQRYISTPHSWHDVPDGGLLGESPQDSFLIESRDGVTWDWLDGDSNPRLICGPPGSPDEVHTGYGRLLRDLDGYLATANGRYQWIYRAQYHDADWVKPVTTPDGTTRRVRKPTLYRPWVASSPSLSTYPWTKASSQAFVALAEPDVSEIGFGSFLVAVGTYWVEYACSDGIFTPMPGNEMLLGGADSVDSMLAAKQQPIPLALNSKESAGGTGNMVAPGGGYIIRDPKTKRQYMVVGGFNPESVESGTHTPRFTVYRAVNPNNPLQ